MPAMATGLVFLLMGLFALLISGSLSTLVTNWNLFLREEDMDTYRSKKRRGIRLLAKVWIALGGCFILVGFISWIFEFARPAS
jgi:hypothetical protein